MMRQRIGDPVNGWDAEHLASDFFRGLEGDIRVKNDTIIVTYYNAPNVDLMKHHYEKLPKKLRPVRLGIFPFLCRQFKFKIPVFKPPFMFLISFKGCH